MFNDYCKVQPEPLLNDSEAANECYHRLPPCELFTEQELPSHQHACDDCGNAFLCEDEHCELGNKQLCEECEIALKKRQAVTNRERVGDCIDDQAVIEQIKLRCENDDHEPWGGLFSSAARSIREYAPKYSKPVSLRRRVCD